MELKRGVSIKLTHKTDAEPVACTLSEQSATDQLAEWKILAAHARSVESIDGGTRMTFCATLNDQVVDLAKREEACCSFLDITTAVAGDELTLDITSEAETAQSVIDILAGIS